MAPELSEVQVGLSEDLLSLRKPSDPTQSQLATVLVQALLSDSLSELVLDSLLAKE